MLEVFDQSRNRVAVLQNAYNVSERQRINAVYELSFSIPDSDPKASFCIPRNFVRYNGGELYRILDYDVRHEEGVTSLVYTCEHVIATLIDHLLFRDHERSGYTTKQNINYLLTFQNDWVLGDCDFTFRYDYAWSSENLLAALFSIPAPFVDYYMFTYDTSSYPWTLNLKKVNPNGSSQFFVWAGVNYLRGQKTTYSSEVVTRLYCLGYGEGVNQLTIEDANNGLPYIQNDDAIAEYGLIEAVYVDRKFEDAQSLLDAGKAILAAASVPRVEYSLDVADLYKITKNDYHKAELGRIVQFVPGLGETAYKTYITELSRDYDNDGMSISVANSPQDIATAIADLADRQRIETTYAQGATQVWAAPFANNADETHPLIYELWIPTNLRVMNEVKVKIKLEKFRAYSKTSSAGGKTTSTITSSSGGRTVSTIASSAGGGTSSTITSSAGGQSTTSSGPSTNETTGYAEEAQLALTSETGPQIGSGHEHYHEYWAPLATHNHAMNHTHQVSTPAHTHQVSLNIPTHTHNVSLNIPAHTHNVSIDIPNHTHEIIPGIWRMGDTPTGATVTIGSQSYTFGATTDERDITQYLLDANGKIPRGKFISIKVTPNSLAYIVMSVAAVGFIQSKTGGNY